MVSEKSKNIIALILFISICLVAEFIGSMLTFISVNDWYQTLTKPTWTPPNWLFGPVWTTLYILMGISAWLVWNQGGFQQNKTALSIFFIQLFFNVIWSGLFFGLQQLTMAFIDIVLLWILILTMIITFYKSHKIAGLINILYLLWVSYAGALNFQIWRLNT